MLDLNKSLEFFNPEVVTKPVHLIGCGAIGSHIAELIARLGITNIHLWDDDVVNTHNLANQNFTANDISRPKVDVVADRILSINPDCKVTSHSTRWKPEGMMSGYVFMCVDSIVPRQEMQKFAMYNNITIFDIRMGLTSGQFYVVPKEKLDAYGVTMNFTDEEADENTPKSACNYELSVAYSIWALLGYVMSAVVKYWSGESVPLTTLVDMNNGVFFI